MIFKNLTLMYKTGPYAACLSLCLLILGGLIETQTHIQSAQDEKFLLLLSMLSN